MGEWEGLVRYGLNWVNLDVSRLASAGVDRQMGELVGLVRQ
jgi:hypothetical protein